MVSGSATRAAAKMSRTWNACRELSHSTLAPGFVMNPGARLFVAGAVSEFLT